MFLSKIKKTHYFLTLLFFVLSLIGILHHELWLDEAHHWLLARDSTSILNLITNIRYEGHPILWNLLLYFITRFTSDPVWMQFLHIAISTSAVFIFLKNSPFSLLFKVMFIFGYFIFFEYNLLSRNYALGVLFLFSACSIYSRRKEKFMLLALFLALACNTHAIFTVIASCLMFVITFEHFRQNGLKASLNFNIGIAIFIAGLSLAILQIIPPSDTSFFVRMDEIPFYEKFYKGLIAFFKGIINIPDFRTIHFWNSNLLININKPLAGILGILSLSIPCFLFYKNKTTLLYVYLGIIGANIFFFVTQMAASRYHGMLYLIVFSGLWIDHYHPFMKNRLNSLTSIATFEKLKKSIVYGILVIHLISGILAYGIDFAKPFSNSERTIAFLEKSEFSHKIIASRSCDGTALSSYLERPIFFTNYNNYQSYCVWGKVNFDGTYSKDTVIKSLENLLKTQDETVIFISYMPFFKIDTLDEWIVINENVKYRFLRKFEESIISKGNYYLFEISKL